jgi:hypothetical protein
MAMGGVGEAMLLGAAMGGGSAALTGGDPLKGALMGGLTGGIGGGIGSLGTAGVNAAAVAPAAEVGAVAANAALPNAVLPNAVTETFAPTFSSGVPPVTSSVPSPDIVARSLSTNYPAAGLDSLNSNLSPNTVDALKAGPTSYDSFGSPVSINSAAYSSADPTGLAQQQLNLNNASAQAATPDIPKTFAQGMQKFADDPMASLKKNAFTGIGAAIQGATAGRKESKEPDEYNGPLKRFKYNPDAYRPSFFAAEGGIASLAGDGYDSIYVGSPSSSSNMAAGGIADLGSYSDGGRMLRGPGDGMSDSIPASISGKRPARLADGEFVVPADVVSHLGNGSTDAGAKQLYAMMNKVRQARTGRKAQGREINPRQYVPA